MCCNDEYIKYYRSWTGMCAFEAHFVKDNGIYIIDKLTVKHGLCEFGVNGDAPASALFIHLITTETGADGYDSWDKYIREWKKLHYKYNL